MSNPYEQILQSAAPPRPKPKPPQVQSAVLSKATKKKPITKPIVRFCLRPRYRFDLPDPPMDPKMLLGQLSTTSYSKPYISSLEKEFRAPAIPADPTHGLHANLVESTLYTRPANLSVDDDALLLSVMSGRPGYTGPKGSPDGSRRASLKAANGRPAPTTTTPWMRRMGYDEYLGGSSAMQRRKLLVKDHQAAAEKLANERKNDPKMIQRRRRQMLQSFELARRQPVHPDRRKAHLKPVNIAPILPDFSRLGQNFVVLEFDKDEHLTVRERQQNDTDAADESVRSLASLLVRNPKYPNDARKLIACYTPSDETLTKRKRRREENDGPTADEKERKKVHFVQEEMYEWIGEFSVRERQLGSSGGKGVPSRSSYAVTEYTREDSKSRVAMLSRIPTIWQLSRRPGLDEHFGKPDLKIRRDGTQPTDDEDNQDIVAGHSKIKDEGKQDVSLA